jgi:hypothetical protein
VVLMAAPVAPVAPVAPRMAFVPRARPPPSTCPLAVSELMGHCRIVASSAGLARAGCFVSARPG